MPLLDPDQQFFFCSRAKNIIPTESRLLFFHKYLPIASQYLKQNFETIKIYPKFKEHFLSSIDVLNKILNLNIPSRDKLESENICDFFRYFYDQLKQPENTFSEGTYFKVKSTNDKYTTKARLKYYETSFGSNTHTWQFLDYSVAILSIYGTPAKKDINREISLLNLEIDLLKSVGFTLVLCMYLNSDEYSMILNLIHEDIFTEIHLNIDRNINSRLEDFITSLIHIFAYKRSNTEKNMLHNWEFHGYFYFYFTYTNDLNIINNTLKFFKSDPYFNRFFYSKSLDSCFIRLIPEEEDPFVYCDVGFKCPMIKVHLNKVPLYDDQFDIKSYSPKEITQLTWGYVKTNDFTTWRGSRVEILFNDNTTSYVDFEDLHVMKPEFFVSDTLHFMKATQSSVDELNKIKAKANELKRPKEQFQRRKIPTFLRTSVNIVEEALSYLLYAIEKLQDKKVRQNQLFAALEASLSCLFSDDLKEKGIVYQLDTGEGKSLIIQMIAALLASTGKMVHIATSNIHLANRDYSQSCEFFKHLGIDSSVLLHSNEIPRPGNNEKEDLEIKYEIFQNDPFFSDAKFENSLDMNFEVCGLGNHGEEISKGCKIVFSTFINFEALYLKMTENWSPKYINEYFKNRYLIIDEADTVLIDELVNGTILSHSLPSNASDVLTFIYQCKTGRFDPESFDRIINHFYPDFANKEIMHNYYSQLLGERLKEIEEEMSKKKSMNDLTKTFLAMTTTMSTMRGKRLEQEEKEYEEEQRKANENRKKIINFIYNTSSGKMTKISVNYIFARLCESDYDITDEELTEIETIYDEIVKLQNPSSQPEPEPKPKQKRSTKKFRPVLRPVEDDEEQKKQEPPKQPPLQLQIAPPLTSFDEVKGRSLYLFICQTLNGSPNPKKIIELVKESWPQSGDLNEQQINQMFKEIEIVHSPEFKNGIRYVILPKKTKKTEKKKKKNKIVKKFIDGVNKVLNFHEEIQGLIEKQIEKRKEKKQKKVELTEDEKNKLADQLLQEEAENEKTKTKDDEKKEEIVDDDEYEEEDEEESKALEVFPYDYDNKGILEQNKEFSGFIQQFIAIKERVNDPVTYKHLKIKGLTFNYLYVSHPIFTELYKKVCGFTGTIGNHYDKEIFKKHYKLSTFKIPRDKPNRRVNLPMILCKDIDDRNKKIKDEVIRFNEQRKPVLVVLRDINEVQKLKELFESYFMKDINVFDGTNVSINPEEIAGRDGSISIGTNFCGRGTDIKNTGQPLHVIVAYYSSNIRTIQQAFGRTARKGLEGTCRIICQVSDYACPNEHIDDKSVTNVVDDFDIKKTAQSSFIEHYRSRFEWIFTHDFKKLQIGQYESEILKQTRINVNRIVAYNYKFPVGMSIDTFLSIQAQKIFSLYNCPNCIYTWMLFQRYVREFLLESWSMMIEKIDIDYLNDPNIPIEYPIYKDYLYSQVDELKKKIGKYFPAQEKTGMLMMFMSFHKAVTNNWCPIIDEIFKSKYIKNKETGFANCFMSINFGFMPYSLMDNSGARVSYFENECERSYIKDPELSYLKSQTNGKDSVLCSITQKIDDLFDMICNTINEKLGAFTGLRFFLRRTIAGCEFGICLDFSLTNRDYSKLGANCLIDKDPLMLFTIHVKSVAPILAGVLVVLLVYAAKIGIFIAEGGIAVLGEKIAKISLSSVLKFLASQGLESMIEKVFESINACLASKLKDQIDNIRTFDSDAADLFEMFAGVFIRCEFESVSEGIAEKFGEYITFNAHAKDIFEMLFPHFFKLSISLVLCLVAFIMNFKHKLALKKEEKKKAIEFDMEKKAAQYQGENAKNALADNEKIVNDINPADGSSDV